MAPVLVAHMGRQRQEDSVDCIACGRHVAREGAREYDPYGDRWDREGKVFDFLCKPCHNEQCHLPRRGLENRLVAIENESSSAVGFISAYFESLRQPDEHEANK